MTPTNRWGTIMNTREILQLASSRRKDDDDDEVDDDMMISSILSGSSLDEMISSGSRNNNWQSNNPQGSNPNTWRSTDEASLPEQSTTSDWQQTLESKQDGSFWSQFELPPETEEDLTKTSKTTASSSFNVDDDSFMVDDSEAWLNALAAISAEEVEFNMVEANRANSAREMAEWGFDIETIKNTFGIAIDDALEEDDVEGMKTFRVESYLEDEDWKVIESHTKVEKDPESGEPIRQQMVRFGGSCMCDVTVFRMD